ncbi:MAG: acireductone synthase [Alphaproteobacteria bacterium]|nr:acireductone synthase [Alphaproteobacteria bacterium]
MKAILLDIEGTTAPISFVAEVLFPFAAERLDAFVRGHAGDPDVADALRETAELEGRALSTDAAIATLLGWIKADRKATPLKTLQGKIWREGYESGRIVSPVYPDAAKQMRAWNAQGYRLDVYSSGSVEAQKLLYGHSDAGDLTPLFGGYFDTRTGPKLEAKSYATIAGLIEHPPADVLFLSDAPGEVAAALNAGMASIRIDRALPAGARQEDAMGVVAADFDVVNGWLESQR